MKKYPPSPKKATAQTVASNNIIAYGIFRFHEGMPICRFHELSHTYATRCIEVGIDVKSLSEMLGHSSVSITLGRYVHSSLAFKKEQINKIKHPFLS